jgi:hypothetical protein
MPDEYEEALRRHWTPQPCLKCGKPSRPGSCFCTSRCKQTWQSSMATWNRRLTTRLAGNEERLLY